jgi:hypothetical protein
LNDLLKDHSLSVGLWTLAGLWGGGGQTNGRNTLTLPKESLMASRRLRERGDKRERWDFQPWQEERDSDDEDIPDRDDEPEPVHTLQ